MMNKVYSAALKGIDGYIVDVEVDIVEGLPSFILVGLPSAGTKEAKERVRSAIHNSEMKFPIKRITVNLAPGDMKKEGTAFDLSIAIGILLCTGAIKSEEVKEILFLGELALDGTLRPINGVLPMVHHAKQKGIKKIFLPNDNVQEASVIDGIDIIAVNNLTEVVTFLNMPSQQSPYVNNSSLQFHNSPFCYDIDFSEVKGQEIAKRALEIAAAGGHNVLIIGSPGAGKTMLAKRLPTILPYMTFEESIEVTKIYSVSGLLQKEESLIKTRPFRSPHHTITASSLVGGGGYPKPGEISLAHNGVLFLDEIPEFKKDVLEVLRQPLEDGIVNISRVNGNISYPSKNILIGSMNPCPCGFFPGDKCSCTPKQIENYLNRISGPLLDRIDIHVEANTIKYEDLCDKKEEEHSKEIQMRVNKARKVQLDRYKKEGIYCNAQLTNRLMKKWCSLDSQSNEILKEAFDKLNLSARAYNRILKVARTIADLEEKEVIHLSNISEAIQYRTLDRKYWNR